MANFTQAWVATGDQENWERGIEQGLWGLTPQLKNNWDRMKEGDLVLFYCKNPVGRIFGAGIVTGTFKQDRPLWKEEVASNKIIWPYRFSFKTIFVIPLDFWRNQGVEYRKYSLPIIAGINPVKNLPRALQVLEALQDSTENEYKPPIKEKVSVAEPALADNYTTISLHRNMQEKVYEIGNMQRYLAEKEVPFDGGRLDVTWKRQLRSVPTFVFEVQISGNMESAFGKLKYAHDLWNSKIVLVTNNNQLRKARRLSDGMFRELGHKLKILSTSQVDVLYSAKKRYFDLEQQMGLM